jgi:hypothetical protein
MRPVSPSRKHALALAALLLGCGGPAVPAKPRLAEGEGSFRLRYNRPPSLTGNADLYFEVEGPAGWERVSLENPDEEQDLLTPLVGLAEVAPDTIVTVEAGFRTDTRAFGEHTARVLRLQSVPSAPPAAVPAWTPPPPPSAPEPTPAP